MNTEHAGERISVTIKQASELSGIGRTKLYELISSKEIQTARIGTRRLVLFESLKRYIVQSAS